ncbi:DDE-type integrase/transposase/recombinase [Limibacillus sp. MBR-115]|uniref:DDE-type integrase/transposase/recombinase n=1 Tax=Limibacillus sp. MBR-115 TaxID=3156465 RepID=UPI003396C75A
MAIHCLCAVDHEGEVLESFVTKRRNKIAALKFLRQTMRKHRRTEVIVTDRTRPYGAVFRKVGCGSQGHSEVRSGLQSSII